MGTGVVVQILIDLIFLSGFAVTWLRLSKPAKDDPRLSRGLQLLQSKIAILEDLSDQTERQVESIAQLIEAKGHEIQAQISTADDQIRKIEAALGKSLEAVHIFQGQIPHEEIVDRKMTAKYVKAARMAHQGLSVDEIAEQVDLTRAEIEFVTKVNRNQLQFSEEDLPAWATLESEVPVAAKPAAAIVTPAAAASSISQNLSKLGDRFRQALEPSEPAAISIRPVAIKTKSASPIPTPSAAISPLAASAVPAEPINAPASAESVATVAEPAVKKVVFPRVDELKRKAIEKSIADRNLG